MKTIVHGYKRSRYSPFGQIMDNWSAGDIGSYGIRVVGCGMALWSMGIKNAKQSAMTRIA